MAKDIIENFEGNCEKYRKTQIGLDENKNNNFILCNTSHFTVYDCFNKGENDRGTRETWLNKFDFYIKHLNPSLEKRYFLTSNI